MTVAAIGALYIDLIYSGVNRLPKPGEEIYYPHFDLQLGGGPAVIPIALNHFGIRSRLGTFLADDMPGRIARELLKNLRFNNYRNFHRQKSGHPVVVTSAISLRHDRSFASHGGVNTRRCPTADETYRFLHGAKVCHAWRPYPKVMKKLRAEGTIVVYDFGWEDNMHISDHAEILQHVDIFTPNDKEAMQLTRTNSPKAALRCLRQYVKNPIVKIGRHGCLTIQGDKFITMPMPCKFKAIDTTGSGDNFLAGIVYGLCRNWDLIDCMKAGNIFGGISTTQLGCHRAVQAMKPSDIGKYMRLY